MNIAKFSKTIFSIKHHRRQFFKVMFETIRTSSLVNWPFLWITSIMFTIWLAVSTSDNDEVKTAGKIMGM